MPSSAPEGWFDHFRDVLRDAEPDPLARYEPLEKLGEGGMAVVYRARDRQLHRDVALKVLKEPLAAEDQLRLRFQREARVLASLSHPNIVTIHDAGEWGGKPYLVMELVRGRPMSHVGGDLRSMLILLEKAARGVAAAHARKIVHRDLKPGNILVTEEGEPKVADFGLAHMVGSKTGLTRTGATVGTPLYMSPEQARGRSADISPRTDVYALGAILYEILTGRPPHSGVTPMEIYGRILSEDPEPPRRRNPKVPRDLETVCLKAVEKDPALRYADAAEFADDLGRHLRGDLVLARRAGRLARAARWGRRNRPAAAGFAVAVAAVLGGALLVVLPAAERSRQREADALYQQGVDATNEIELSLATGQADAAWTAERAEAALGLLRRALEAVSDHAGALVLSGRLREIQGRKEEAEEFHARAIRAAPRAPDGYFHRGRLLLERYREMRGPPPLGLHSAAAGGRISVGGLTEETTGMTEIREKGLRDLAEAGRLGIEEKKRIYSRAALDFSEGRYEGAADEFREYLHAFPADASAHLLRGRANTYLRRFDEARADFDAALRCRPGYVRAFFDRSLAHFGLGDLDAAIRDLNRIIEKEPRNAGALGNRAIFHAYRGERSAALQDGESAVEAEPGEPRHRQVLAMVLEKQRDFSGAVEAASEAIRLDPGFHTAYLTRAWANLNRGELGAAERDIEEAFRLRSDRAETHALRGLLRMAQGNLPAALEDFDAAVGMSPGAAEFYCHRGVLRNAMGDGTGALAEYEKALEVDPACAQAHYNRGNARLAKGDLEGAYQDYDAAIRLDPLLADAYTNRGNLRGRRGELREAVEDYDAAIRLKPDDPLNLTSRGNAFRQLREWAKALADFDRAIELAPRHFRAWVQRGLTHYEKGDHRKALSDLERALRIDPSAEADLQPVLGWLRKNAGGED